MIGVNARYPPSLAYALLTTGINLALLTVLRRHDLAQQAREPGYLSAFIDKIRLFGEVPLFFYMVHWLVLGTIGFVVRLTGSHGIFLPWLIPIWVCECVILYWPCKWYGAFKNGTSPESLWRLL